MGLAVSVDRQQPAAAGLGERGGRGVLRGQRRFGVGRPLDADGRVEGIHSVLASGRVRRRAQVDDGRLLGEGGKGMPEPHGDEHGTPALIVQPHRLPAPVAGRADPDVDDHVQDRALDAGDVLGLARGDVGEVDTPDDSPA